MRPPQKENHEACTSPTPVEAGFRLPAEWERQEAVWLSWPRRPATWPGNFQQIPRVFAGIAAQISRFEKVRMNVARPLQAGVRALLNRARADMANVELYAHATNDCWCRDHGPIFLKHRRTGEVALTDWEYNAWGGKYPPYHLDGAIPARITRALGLRRFPVPMILEGGSIDGNGDGMLLTTESCLLNPNRNPHLSRRQIERMLGDYLGAKQIVWLGDGVAGDDTDGHVDDLSRFFRADGIVTAVERNPRDVNYAALKENRERLRGLLNRRGERIDIVELPMPGPCVAHGQRLPATYANFLILNGAVLMPAFRQKRRDAEAAEILGSCFPSREIVPLDCVDLVRGRGALHCISQQQPAADPL